MNELQGIHDFQLFKNPIADGSLQLRYSLKEPNTMVEIKIYDLGGRTIYLDNFNQNSVGALIKNIDVTQFAKGLYFCQLVINNVSTIKKILSLSVLQKVDKVYFVNQKNQFFEDILKELKKMDFIMVIQIITLKSGLFQRFQFPIKY